MNGILFYLDRDVPLVHGHAIYIDSEWALTSISQAPVLARRRPRALGDGRVGGSCRSTSPSGTRRASAPARSRRACSREEIRAEVWGQLDDHLNDGALDGVERASPGSSTRRSSSPTRRGATNLEPLLINTAGSWADRPDARPRSRT